MNGGRHDVGSGTPAEYSQLSLNALSLNALSLNAHSPYSARATDFAIPRRILI